MSNRKNLNVTQFKEFTRIIIDDLYRELHKLKKMFKYSVTVLLQQKVGAALNYGSAIYVDNTADGQITHFYNDSKYYDLVFLLLVIKLLKNLSILFDNGFFIFKTFLNLNTIIILLQLINYFIILIKFLDFIFF